MNKEPPSKLLWVVKFCLRIVYPKLNYQSFLVYLAIKYRKHYNKRAKHRKVMETYKVKTISAPVQRLFAKRYSDDNASVISHKCLIISRNQYIQLATENLFYLDNGVLWVTLKLSPNNVTKQKQKHEEVNKKKLMKYNLNFITSEVHKKLWANMNSGSYNNCRVMPIIGSNCIEEDVVATSEIEHHNMFASLGLNTTNDQDIEISVHPVMSLDYAPKIAAMAEVSLIVNEYDLSNDFIKEVLNNYFEVPKLLHNNDIFSIDLTPETTAKFHYKYLDLMDSVGRLYLKCVKLNGDSDQLQNVGKIDQPFFIVKGVTQLTLGETVHSLKPRDEYYRFPECSDSQTNISTCPTGLRNIFTDMQETITPFLSGELNELTSALSSPIIPILLLTGASGSGKQILIKTLSKYNGINCLRIDCNALQSSTAKQTESKMSTMIQRAKTAAPVLVLMDNFEVFAVDAENNEDCRLIEYFENSLRDLYQNYTKHSIIFVAVTERQDLKPNILRIFLEKFHIPKLSNVQRCEMLEWFSLVHGLKFNQANRDSEEKQQKTQLRLHADESSVSTECKEMIQRVAAKTETFRYGDIDTLLHFALRESYLQQHHSSHESAADTDMRIVEEKHFDSALESMRSLQSQHLDAPKIPKVYWDDIGGLDKLKKELLKTIEFPIKYPHLFKNSSLKRSGILLYGPPGCGKTLVAKAVSTEMNVSFLSVKGPELLNMYIGQSEENVRKVFSTARASSPCIVFLDELDALAARRGAAGDSGGAADRLVSQLLAELDGVATGEDADPTSFVFIIGATNRPDLLEPSLLRPGRLDKLIYVGPYCGVEEKTKVLKSLCRSHNVDAAVSLELVAEALPERVTGADLLQVVSTARAAAVRALVHKLQQGLLKESELSADSVVISVSDMQRGVAAFRCSVTDEELAYYEALKHQM
ncbi:peroxisome assembly factor 2 [Plutella xylostella]|uniref:peroxisome assembly factor 2 n=1 Tax=Plutella xylostella TaxID=51655 RepID=UPI0020329E81|nr:peroxisome assembly factor 2 [Plutella xylostella]